ncbi:MAG TPA: DnaJ domain-containing protein [Candidatus Limnocylindria bacterium]|nr:DnaJ domain-containing protein [Candidatus Limnocylindria bacterium]
MYPSLLPYAPERDVYRLLQVHPTATSEEITAACRRLARTFHPDRNRSPRAHEEMQVVNAVRLLLTDPRSRAAYDGARRRYLSDGYRPPAAHVTYAAVARHRPTAPTIEPFVPVAPGWGTRALRWVRAVGAGLRGMLSELGPPRCSACRELIEVGDRYCPRCGLWLGPTEKLGA